MGKQISVYVDKGVSPYYLKHLMRWLKKYLQIIGIDMPCVRVNAQTLLYDADWEQYTSLLIIPGGADRPYQQALSGLGTQRILQFVTQGGSYLGICAGAYFGARWIRFREPDGSLLEELRDLGFFPGAAIGPAYNLPFSYVEPTGVCPASLYFKEVCQQGHALFNGGCYFEHADLYPDIHVEACYQDLPNQPASIVSRRFGEGLVILSGVHMEYLPEYCEMQHENLRRTREFLQFNQEIAHNYTINMLQRLLGRIELYSL